MKKIVHFLNFFFMTQKTLISAFEATDFTNIFCGILQPLCFLLFQILQEGQWLSEVKDLNRRYGALPPINAGNTIKPNAMAFTVD